MASTREWFETVEGARRRARRHLPRSVYMSLVAGTEKGLTLRDNVAAFSELRFAPPHIAGLPSARQQATSVLGQEISLPVIASPTGVQAVHPDGELAVALATAEAGTAMGLSAFASRPVEEVAAANPKLFFQVYWSGSKDAIMQRIERARNAGAQALIVTLDWSFSNGRDWGSPAIPEKMDLRAIIRFAPEGLARPGYVRQWLQAGGLPDLTVPNMAAPGRRPRPSSACTANGCRPPRRAGPTWPGCASSGVARSWSRASCGPMTPVAAWTSAPAPSRCPITAATTWMAPPPPSGHCPRWPTPWAARSRCCWTAGSGVAATWSRRWPWVPARS